ncbi:MAG: class I SAM-dependent methyltransferase [Gaiellaceae bacterium]
MAELTPEERAAHNRTQLRYYETQAKPGMVPTGSPYLRRHVEELVRFARLEAGERVLEVGCGMGRYTLLFAERGIAVEGIDLSPMLLDRLRAFDGGRFDIPLHPADVADPPAELLGRFDAVVGLFTLHHLHDLGPSFRAMTRLLAPGGRIAFLEPNPYNPLYYVQMAVTPGMTWEGDRGMVRMRRSVIFSAMAAAGFREPALRRFGFFPPVLANTARWRRVEAALERRRALEPVLPFQLFGGALPPEVEPPARA